MSADSGGGLISADPGVRARGAGKVLTDEEIERWEGVFDEDCSMQNFWHKCAPRL